VRLIARIRDACGSCWLTPAAAAFCVRYDW
jgi:hypothetical protein